MNVRFLIVEAIGTFFLVFTVGMCVIDPGAGVLAPVAIGTVLALMIYAGGHISGGHYNPAVTLGVLVRGKSTVPDAVGYWVAQIVGAVVAWAGVTYLKPAMPAAALKANVAVGPGLLAEFLFTFALVYVVLNVATTKATDGNSFYGWAIGFTVTVGVLTVGGITGGAFNPAVAIGGSLMNILAWGNLWIYLVAELAAGAAAALLYLYLNPREAPNFAMDASGDGDPVPAPAGSRTV
ncbi:MAG: MIP/aquaporin family protein [Chloroflexota bacterium]